MVLKKLFFLFVIRPLLLIIGGMRVSGSSLPTRGPAILVANHNSHLDALALLSLFPLKTLPRVRPVAARDYFCSTPLRRFISRYLLGILPIDRRPRSHHDRPLDPLLHALDRGEILLIFPEGSRGDPGELRPFKSGFAHLAKKRPDVPVIPVRLRGTDRALPRNEALWVPFVLEVQVADAHYFSENVSEFTQKIEAYYRREEPLQRERSPAKD
ncbi:lysophospholipid acyltransferase family protein [Nitratifractor sp.]